MESKRYKFGGRTNLAMALETLYTVKRTHSKEEKNQPYRSRNLMQNYLKFKRDVMNKEYTRNSSLPY